MVRLMLWGAFSVGSMGSPQRMQAWPPSSYLASMGFGVALPSSSALALRAVAAPTLSGLFARHLRMLSLTVSLLALRQA